MNKSTLSFKLVKNLHKIIRKGHWDIHAHVMAAVTMFTSLYKEDTEKELRKVK